MDRTAANCDGLIETIGAGGQANRLDRSEIIDRHQTIDVDAVCIGTAHRVADNHARRGIVDHSGRVSGQIQVDAGAVLASDRTAVVDGDRCITGDAVARAIDLTTGIIVDDTARSRLEVDSVVAVRSAAAVVADDLAVVVDRGVGTGADRVGIRSLNHARRIVGDDRMSIGRRDIIEVECLAGVVARPGRLDRPIVDDRQRSGRVSSKISKS